MSKTADINDISMIVKSNDDLFLDLIKERPCLYDKSIKDYHDKIIVENAMEEIAFIMQDSVENCEQKWKNLKQAYSREKTLQELECRSGNGASTRKQFVHFNRMKDLYSANTSRHTYCNVPQNAEDCKTQQCFTKLNRKRKSVNPVEVTLNNIETTITSMLQSTKNENVESENVDNDVDILTGKMVKARLNELNPTIAKKKRKQIMKCLIDSDSDDEN